MRWVLLAALLAAGPALAQSNKGQTLAGVTSFNTRSGAVAPMTGDYAVGQVTGAAPIVSPTFTGTVTIPGGASISGFAPLASPAFTGVPAAPTATALTSTTQLSTTAFTTLAVGVETSRATTAEGLLAPLASPTFSGTPAVPTASSGTNTTQIATTAFVTAAAGSGAEQTISYQPGLLSSVVATPAVFGKFVKASTVDNIIVSALTLTCVTPPTIALLECGSSTTCATPTTIGSVQVVATGTATPATVSSSAIVAGDYVAWEMTAGTCTSVNVSGSSQIHAN